MSMSKLYTTPLLPGQGKYNEIYLACAKIPACKKLTKGGIVSIAHGKRTAFCRGSLSQNNHVSLTFPDT